MPTTDKLSYGTDTAITCTLASLASSATAGRQSAVVDNSSNLFVDAILTIAVKTSASALANDKACYVYLFGCGQGGSIHDGSSAEGNGGGDSAITIDDPTNMIGPFVIPCPAVSTTYRKTIRVAAAFGGILPYKWGFALRNYTGQALDATGGSHNASYTGVYFQNV